MTEEQLLHSSTAELLAALQNGSLTSQQLTQTCLDRIEKLNPHLNAFLSVQAEQALAAAAEIDARRSSGQKVGPLGGLPIGIKDNISMTGAPTTCASRMLNNYHPPFDATVVEKIRAADGVIIGKLNLDEFAMGSSNETSWFGTARNPWNTEHSPGGSSGGSASAVAASLVPLALGSDTGGSIRQPASFCGVTGMKPTYGRVSRYGLVAFASSLDQIGPLAKDTDGAALLMNVIAGHDPRDTTSVPADVPDYGRDLKTPLDGLRVGIVEEHYGEGISAGVAEGVRAAIESLKAAGATVTPVQLPHSKYCIAAYYLIAPSEASSNLARYDGIHYGYRSERFDPARHNLVDLYCQSRGDGFGAEVKRRIMLGTYALSAGYYDAYYLKALKVRRRIREDFDRAFEEVDVIAGPAAPTTAFAIGEKTDDPLAMYLNDIYTISANLAGIPAISVPCAISADTGLPVGLQLQGPAFKEDRLLQAAAAVERAAELPACPV